MLLRLQGEATGDQKVAGKGSGEAEGRQVKRERLAGPSRSLLIRIGWQSVLQRV